MQKSNHKRMEKKIQEPAISKNVSVDVITQRQDVDLSEYEGIYFWSQKVTEKKKIIKKSNKGMEDVCVSIHFLSLAFVCV